VAFNKRLDSIFPGMGVGLRNDAVLIQTGIALSTTGQQSTPIPASGVLAPTTSAGRIRIKIYNGGGTSPTLIDLLVTATDGTNTVLIPQSLIHPTVAWPLTTATSWFEFEFEFILDVASSGAGGGAVGQLSGVIGGANAFSVKTTLGGTTPTASMDLELVPLI
jgi:hypothetical protein